MSGGAVWADREPTRAMRVAEWKQSLFGTAIESETCWELVQWAREAAAEIREAFPDLPEWYLAAWRTMSGGDYVVEAHTEGEEPRVFRFGYYDGCVFSAEVVKAAIWDLVSPPDARLERELVVQG